MEIFIKELINWGEMLMMINEKYKDRKHHAQWNKNHTINVKSNLTLCCITIHDF